MWNVAKTTSRPKWRSIAKPCRYPARRVRQVGLPGGSPMAPANRKAAAEKIAWWPVSVPIFNRRCQPPLFSPARASQLRRPKANRRSLRHQLINQRYRQANPRRQLIAKLRPQTRAKQSLEHLQVIKPQAIKPQAIYPQVIYPQVIELQPIKLQGA